MNKISPPHTSVFLIKEICATYEQSIGLSLKVSTAALCMCELHFELHETLQNKQILLPILKSHLTRKSIVSHMLAKE